MRKLIVVVLLVGVSWSQELPSCADTRCDAVSGCPPCVIIEDAAKPEPSDYWEQLEKKWEEEQEKTEREFLIRLLRMLLEELERER